MDQHELLTALDNWPIGGKATDYKSAVLEAVPLMNEAAAEIRRLSPQFAPLTDEETAVVLDVFGRTDSEAEAGP